MGVRVYTLHGLRFGVYIGFALREYYRGLNNHQDYGPNIGFGV